MNEDTLQILNKINNSISKDDFYYLCDDFVGELNSLKNKFEAIEPLLKIIENNPNTNFGNPGPFVHFLEKFNKNGYEEELIKSVNRKPVNHNIWMLNRLINGSNGPKKEEYLKELYNIRLKNNLPKYLLDQVNSFIEFQNK